MSDREQIERLINVYGHIFDAKQWDRLGELFSTDAVFLVDRLGVALHGLDEIVAAMSAAKHPIAHYVTNVVIDVEEGADNATALVKIFAPRENGSALVGTYHDALVRAADGWRFQLRDVRLVDTGWGAPAAAKS